MPLAVFSHKLHWERKGLTALSGIETLLLDSTFVELASEARRHCSTKESPASFSTGVALQPRLLRLLLTEGPGVFSIMTCHADATVCLIWKSCDFELLTGPVGASC
jgi:hypothetical protein